MSQFTVDLTEINRETAPIFGASEFVKRRRWPRILGLTAGILSVIVLSGIVIGYFYWQTIKVTPQYSLALLVSAAKNDDKAETAKLVNIDSVVDDFIPQVTGKAVELYGKGLPPKIVGQLAQLAAPIVPAVKERARVELPRIIRERVEQFRNVPFAAMVIGAGRYLDIKVDGDNAVVSSKLPDHPLELKMRRSGDRWQIVGVRDDDLATDIARKIGQDIIAIAVNGGVRKTADTLGVGNLTDLLRKAEELVK
ncbi:MAG: hypothetical protein ABJA02_01595 [Acidobacteriota bacterium]